MIQKTFLVETLETNPYRNLAFEEYLLRRVGEGECILYLWQNRKTVVIGRNQNPWKECRVEDLEREEGFLARRLSGGGAVFHDLGNLNFTFLMQKEDYSISRQLDVIVRALCALGVPCEKSGRNDVTVEGRKVSGNAFYESGKQNYHHGTLLVHVDKDMLSRYLNVSKEKLKAKGVDSVRSRVANLTEFLPTLTVEKMKQALSKAFMEEYGVEAQKLPVPSEDQALKSLTSRYASKEWRLGKTVPFTFEASRRFAWGDIGLELRVENGIVADAAAYSDAMEPFYIEGIPEALRGKPFAPRQMGVLLRALAINEAQAQIAKDVSSLFDEPRLAEEIL